MKWREILGLVCGLLAARLACSEQEILLKKPDDTHQWHWRVYKTVGSGFINPTSIKHYYAVCDVINAQSPTNWLLVDFVKTKNAKRVFIEVEYTMRNCPNDSKYCQPEFHLYYYHTDTKDDKTDPQQGRFTYLSTISPQPLVEQKVHTFTSSISVRANGVYFAFLDKGACFVIKKAIIWNNFCPGQGQGQGQLVSFPRTIAPFNDSQPAYAEGQCLDINSVNKSRLLAMCTSSGNWNMSGNSDCYCKAGYGFIDQKCEACSQNKYKHTIDNSACQPCPDNSSPSSNKETCHCNKGFYRAPADVSKPCEDLPSAVTGLEVISRNSTAITLQWVSHKKATIWYDVKCSLCEEDDCQPNQPPCNNTVYSPGKTGIQGNRVVISGLEASTTYQFKLYSVSQLNSLEPDRAKWKSKSVTGTTESDALYEKPDSSGQWNWTVFKTVGSGFTDPTSIRHYYAVCDVADFSEQPSNWLLVDFVETKNSKRVSIEVHYTMRKCPDKSRYCKPEFYLYYYHTDTKNDQTDPRNGQFTKLSTISPKPLEEGKLYTFTSSIAVQKRGIYFAFLDKGACFAMRRAEIIRYNFCPERGQGQGQLVSFPRTIIPFNDSQPAYAEGNCLDINSVNTTRLLAMCTSIGKWNILGNSDCYCKAGYGFTDQKCKACSQNKYKGKIENSACQPCPDNSSPSSNKETCYCSEGFYRDPADVSKPCEGLPSAVSRLEVILRNSTAITLQWVSHKKATIWYEVRCSLCEEDDCQLNQQPCKNAVYSPRKTGIKGNKVTISGLEASTTYQFELYSVNELNRLEPNMANWKSKPVMGRTESEKKTSSEKTKEKNWMLGVMIGLTAVLAAFLVCGAIFCVMQRIKLNRRRDESINQSHIPEGIPAGEDYGESMDVLDRRDEDPPSRLYENTEIRNAEIRI